MKRNNLIAAIAAGVAALASAYLIGADGTMTAAPQTGTPMQQPTSSVQQVMQAPALETVECSEGYILLVPCPVCHTCPVCQANCGTAHALRCCLGNKKQSFGTPNAVDCGTSAGSAAGMPPKQHIMTNKAEAVKHAAGHTAAPQMQSDSAELSVLTIEAD